jgi:hypothetical protein
MGLQTKVQNLSMAMKIIVFWDVTPFSLVDYNDHGVTSQRMAVFIVLAMRTSDFIKYDRWFLAAEY